MDDINRPITARELAGLLRAFADMIERRAEADESPRRRRRSPMGALVASDIGAARAKAILANRHGIR